MTEPSLKTDRTRLHRHPERGAHDFAAVAAVLDEGLLCHVAIADGDQPLALPMAYARDGETLLLHGSARSRAMRLLAEGTPACVTVTLVDGLVLAAEAMHHSMNFRSAVILGRARELTEPADKRRAFARLLDHTSPGRSEQLPPIPDADLAATRVVALPIREASVKTRSGPPAPPRRGVASTAWTGVIPLALVRGERVRR